MDCGSTTCGFKSHRLPRKSNIGEINVFVKRNYLIYLPTIAQYVVVRARSEGKAVEKLHKAYRSRLNVLQNYTFIRSARMIE